MKQLQTLLEFSTAEISDALDSCGVEGALLQISTLLPGMKLAGPAYTVRYSAYAEKPDNFRAAADYIDEVPAQSVIIIDNNGRDDCTVWGDILTQAALQQGIAGTVIFGAARDVACIRELNYPVFCHSTYMRSGKNRVYKSDEQCPLTIQSITINPGDIIFADDNGVLVIPVQLLDDVLGKAKNIKRTEEKIVAAIKAGTPLAEARRQYQYDQPWLTCDD